jgi:hypothetical protein
MTDRLREVERRAWRSVFSDGLWDIMLGCILLGMGVAAVLQDAAGLARGLGYVVYAAGTALGALVIAVGKRRVTIPRLGWVDFGVRARTRRRRALVVLAIAVPLTLALILVALAFRPRLAALPEFSAAPIVQRTLIGLPAAGMVFIVLSLLALFLDFPRLLLHALIWAGAVLGAEMTETGYPLLAGAVTVLAIGITHLLSFIRRYPLPRPEKQDAGS